MDKQVYKCPKCRKYLLNYFCYECKIDTTDPSNCNLNFFEEVFGDIFNKDKEYDK